MSIVAQQLRLCLVTDSDLCASYGLVPTVQAAVAGGVSMVQLRLKHASTAERVAQAQALQGVLQGTSVALIINDDVEAALASGATGLHIGQKDLSVAEARRRLGPGPILGLSCGNEAELAAVDPDLVDYVGLGPVFATPTKPEHSPPIGIDGLQRLIELSPVASIAIGGLKQEHGVPVMRAGADGMAVVSAICGQPDPEAATRALARGALTGGMAW